MVRNGIVCSDSIVFMLKELFMLKAQPELRSERPDCPQWATRLFVNKHIPELLLHVAEKTTPPGRRRDNTQRELGVVVHRQRSSQQRGSCSSWLVHGESGVGQKRRLDGIAVYVHD